MTDEEMRAYVEASCKASGVPFTVEDPDVLQRIFDRLLAPEPKEKAS